MRVPVTLLLIGLAGVLFFLGDFPNWLLFDDSNAFPGFYAIWTEGASKGPMFLAIRDGEIWRLFTPSLLHANWMHLAFNVLWLFFLGTLVEQRIGSLGFALLVLFVGIFSNTCQYLMSGPYFLGLSGVITGLVGFVWMRKRHSFWPIPRMTLWMVAIFVVGSALLQLVFFLSGTGFSTGMANTAHVTGALAGAIAGSYERA